MAGSECLRVVSARSSQHGDYSVTLNLAPSRHPFFGGRSVPSLRAMDPLAIEKPLDGSGGTAIPNSISSIEDWLLPAERAQQDEAIPRLHSEDKPSCDGPSNRADAGMGSLVLTFLGMLFAGFIGFVSEIRPPDPNLLDRGYDEALGTRTFSHSSSTPLNSLGKPAAIAGRSKYATDAVRARVEYVDEPSRTSRQAKAIGGVHVD